MNWIKQARSHSGLTQQQLARRIGISQAHLSRLENGGQDVRISTMIRVISAVRGQLKDISATVGGNRILIIEGMPIVLRDKPPGYNWGWYSRDDQRMHLQVIDKKHKRLKYKVWLETKGKRVFEPVGDIASLDAIKKLKEAVRKKRDFIEDEWVSYMLDQGWIQTSLEGTVVTVTAYPNSHNRYTRTFSIKKGFPGVYQNTRKEEWPQDSDIGLDREHLFLVIFKNRPESRQLHVPLSEILWRGKS